MKIDDITGIFIDESIKIRRALEPGLLESVTAGRNANGSLRTCCFSASVEKGFYVLMGCQLS